MRCVPFGYCFLGRVKGTTRRQPMSVSSHVWSGDSSEHPDPISNSKLRVCCVRQGTEQALVARTLLIGPKGSLISYECILGRLPSGSDWCFSCAPGPEPANAASLTLVCWSSKLSRSLGVRIYFETPSIASLISRRCLSTWGLASEKSRDDKRPTASKGGADAHASARDFLKSNPSSACRLA